MTALVPRSGAGDGLPTPRAPRLRSDLRGCGVPVDPSKTSRTRNRKHSGSLVPQPGPRQLRRRHAEHLGELHPRREAIAGRHQVARGDPRTAAAEVARTPCRHLPGRDAGTEPWPCHPLNTRCTSSEVFTAWSRPAASALDLAQPKPTERADPRRRRSRGARVAERQRACAARTGDRASRASRR